MSDFRFGDSTSKSAALPLVPQYDWQSAYDSHQKIGSQASLSTCIIARPSFVSKTSSDDSRRSRVLRVRNGNESLLQGPSQTTLLSTRTSSSSSSVRRSYISTSRKNSRGEGLPTPPRLPSTLGILLDSAPWGEIAPNDSRSEAGSLSSRISGHKAGYITEIGSQNGSNKENSALAPRHSPDTTQEAASPRPFTVAQEHPFKTNHGFPRWMGNMFGDGPSRARSLKLRTKRWTLDRSEEGNISKPDSVRLKNKYEHRRASSWSSFGFQTPGKHDVRGPKQQPVKEDGARSNRQPGVGILRGNRPSREIGRMSVEEDQPHRLDTERRARHRAIRRQNIVEELLGSEESHIVDLKVLFHVGQNSVSSGYDADMRTISGLHINAELDLQHREKYTAADFSKC